MKKVFIAFPALFIFLSLNIMSFAESSVVECAELFEGAVYTFGGSTPESGFDCSGFVYYVFSSCGYSVSRTADGQNTDGLGISLSMAEPGDIIVFGSGSTADHTAIYVGDGKIIHALNEESGVVLSDLSDYSSKAINVRRIY